MTKLNPVSSVLIHVDDVGAGLQWYQQAFPNAVKRHLADYKLDYLDNAGVMIEIVPADASVKSGAAGSVVYWHTADFEARLAYLLSLGATLYRGPLEAENGMQMCQVKDPWGNCIGLKG